MQDDKASLHQVESFNATAIEKDGVDRHLQVQVPSSLVGLSAEEIAEVDRKATRKLDILLMPILVVLYIL